MEMQQEQMVRLIEGLLRSQNDLIRGLGITDIQAPPPLDEVWYDVQSAMMRARKRTQDILEQEKQVLENKNGDLRRECDELVRTVETLNQTQSELKAQVTDLKKETEQLEQRLTEKTHMLEATEQRLGENKAELDRLNTKISDQEKQINTLMEQNTELTGSKAELEQHLSENKADLDRLNTKILDQEKQINTLMEQNTELTGSKTELEQSLQEMRGNAEKDKALISRFDTLTEKWRPLLKHVVECTSMVSYCTEENICNDGDIGSLLHFIEIVGAGTGFARTICNRMLNYRKEKDKAFALQEDEIRLMQAVNTFYRKKYGEKITYDVLFLPDGFTKENVSGTRVRFKPDEMRHYKSSIPIQFAGAVIIPGYRGIDGSVDPAKVTDAQEA